MEIVEDKQDYVKLYENSPTHEIVKVMSGLQHMYGHIQVIFIYISTL